MSTDWTATGIRRRWSLARLRWSEARRARPARPLAVAVTVILLVTLAVAGVLTTSPGHAQPGRTATPAGSYRHGPYP